MVQRRDLVKKNRGAPPAELFTPQFKNIELPSLFLTRAHKHYYIMEENGYVFHDDKDSYKLTAEHLLAVLFVLFKEKSVINGERTVRPFCNWATTVLPKGSSITSNHVSEYILDVVYEFELLKDSSEEELANDNSFSTAGWKSLHRHRLAYDALKKDLSKIFCDFRIRF